MSASPRASHWNDASHGGPLDDRHPPTPGDGSGLPIPARPSTAPRTPSRSRQTPPDRAMPGHLPRCPGTSRRPRVPVPMGGPDRPARAAPPSPGQSAPQRSGHGRRLRHGGPPAAKADGRRHRTRRYHGRRDQRMPSARPFATGTVARHPAFPSPVRRPATGRRPRSSLHSLPGGGRDGLGDEYDARRLPDTLGRPLPPARHARVPRVGHPPNDPPPPAYSPGPPRPTPLGGDEA